MRGGALLLLSGLAIALAGCGKASPDTTPEALRLQREDLVAVSHALKGVESPVGREVASAKSAWPLIVNGLPADSSSAATPVAAAARDAAGVVVPPLLRQPRAASLTGPGAQLAGLFRSYTALSQRGWTLVGAAVEQAARGAPATARFARENVPLYIESVYDAHFTLAQIGKKLPDAYRKLGGPAAFGSALSRREVEALAHTYSEASDRLHPHVAAELGS